MTNINNQPKTEYEVGTEFVFNGEPEARGVVLAGLGRAVEHIKLETRMLTYDALHGTHYRQIRHDLVAAQKRERFEASIGLVALGKK